MYKLTDTQMENVITLLDKVEVKGLKEVMAVAEIVKIYNESQEKQS